jgi:hypothetical protein
MNELYDMYAELTLEDVADIIAADTQLAGSHDWAADVL